MNTSIAIHEVTKIEAKTRHNTTSYGDYVVTTITIVSGEGNKRMKTDVTLFSDKEVSIEYPTA